MNIPNLSSLKNVVNLGKNVVKAYRPEILFATSVTGTLAAVALGAKGGYDARGRVEEERMSRVDSPEAPYDNLFEYVDLGCDLPDLSVKEKAALTWSCYTPAALATLGAVGSTTGLHLVHIKEKKQLAAAALVAIEEVKTSAKEYVEDLQDAVSENTTAKTQDKIDKAVEEKQEARALVRDPLYYVQDARTGRPFLSTESRVQAAINEVNNLLTNNRDVDVNTFYVWANLPEIENGEEIGWNSGDFVTLRWSDTHLDDGTPVREFSFSPRPQENYDSPRNLGKGSR